jgi:hypothetical protein
MYEYEHKCDGTNVFVIGWLSFTNCLCGNFFIITSCCDTKLMAFYKCNMLPEDYFLILNCICQIQNKLTEVVWSWHWAKSSDGNILYKNNMINNEL